MSHEELSPSAAALVAARIGATGAGAMDVNAACSGFVSALTLAAGQVEAGRARTVLVVGADLMTRLTDPTDRGTAALFGDGAGAVLVSACATPGGVGPAVLGRRRHPRPPGRRLARGGDPAHERPRHLPPGGRPALRVDARRRLRSRQARWTTSTSSPSTRPTAGSSPRSASGSASIATRVIDCIDRYGNTSAATIPLALADAHTAGRLEAGSTGAARGVRRRADLGGDRHRVGGPGREAITDA